MPKLPGDAERALEQVRGRVAEYFKTQTIARPARVCAEALHLGLKPVQDAIDALIGTELEEVDLVPPGQLTGGKATPVMSYRARKKSTRKP